MDGEKQGGGFQLEAFVPHDTPDALMRGRSRDSVRETDEGGSGAQTRRIRG